MHFAASNSIVIDTKVTTNDDKSTIHSIIGISIVPQSVIPSSKSCYQTGGYVVVRYNNS